MKILGISGSPRTESRSGSIKVVPKILENTGFEFELYRNRFTYQSEGVVI